MMRRSLLFTVASNYCCWSYIQAHDYDVMHNTNKYSSTIIICKNGCLLKWSYHQKVMKTVVMGFYYCVLLVTII